MELANGIIPARAGSSSSYIRNFFFNWDHPRACGEQQITGGKSSESQGSSPRVRGAEPVVRVELDTSGIIPARAGSSKAHISPLT